MRECKIKIKGYFDNFSNYLIPTLQGHIHTSGSIIDVMTKLPVQLKETNFSYLKKILFLPPNFIERNAHITCKLENGEITAPNWTELVLKMFYHTILEIEEIGTKIKETLGTSVPIVSFDIEPTTALKLISLDYYEEKNCFKKIIELIEKDVLSPTLTFPFQIIMTNIKNKVILKNLIRLGILIYRPIFQLFHVKKNINIIPVWFPENSFNEEIISILIEEIEEVLKIKDFSLLIFIDNYQTIDPNNYNIVRSLHYSKVKGKIIYFSVKNREFCDYLAFSQPDISNVIEKIIEKKDNLKEENKLHYSWNVFFEFEDLLRNYQLKKIFKKLIFTLEEEGFPVTSPLIFVIGKIAGILNKWEGEPFELKIKENSTGTGWHLPEAGNGRWMGWEEKDKKIDKDHPYERVTPFGRIKEQGYQCWKIAYNHLLDKFNDLIFSPTSELSVFKAFSQIKRFSKSQLEEKLEFLEDAHGIYFKYYYKFFEKRYNLDFNRHLTPKWKISEEESIYANLLVRSYYFGLEAQRSTATFWENFDQRFVAQNITFLSLSLIHLIFFYHYLNQDNKIKQILDFVQENLYQFEDYYHKLNLIKYDISDLEWEEAIASELLTNKENLIKRTCKRVFSTHLSFLKEKFPQYQFLDSKYSSTTSATGYVWSYDVLPQFIWKNKFICGEE